MSISQYLKTGAGIAALAGTGGLAAGLGLAGGLFGMSSGDRLKKSRDAAQQSARERFDPSIYQPMQTQGQTMATQGLGRMEDIARERTVASLFRQGPQSLGSSARDLSLQQQQSGMARQALAGFEGQLTQADIARRQEGEMMATQAETQMRDTKAQRGSALENIDSMYQAERARRRDATFGAILGTAGQLGATYLMGRGTGGEITDDVAGTGKGLPADIFGNTPGTGETLDMFKNMVPEQTGASGGNVKDILGNMIGSGQTLGQLQDLELQFGEQEGGRFANQFADAGNLFGDRLTTPEQPDRPEPGIGVRLTDAQEGELGPFQRGLQGLLTPEETQSAGLFEAIPMLGGQLSAMGRDFGQERLQEFPFPQIDRGGRNLTNLASAGAGAFGRATGLISEPTQIQGEQAGQTLQNIMQDTPESAQRAFGGIQNMFGEETPEPINPVGDEYQDMLSNLETEHSLPSGLLNQVMMTESSGNVDATSPKGATGLFQFMGPTADELGIDPNDPIQSAQGAAQYLSKLIEQFGSVELGLAAYNAGQGNVRKHGGIPPFSETQNYVTNIMDALNR